MEIDEAKRLCDRWLPLWTGNRPEELIQAYADDVFYRDSANPEGVEGKPAFLAYLRQLLARFPDWVYQAESMIPMEGGFVLRWRATIPVGDTVLNETGMDLVLVDQGRITRNEIYFDRAAPPEELRGGTTATGRGMSAAGRDTLLDGDALLDEMAAILARDGVELWGTAPSRAMEDERPGYRPSDLLAGARSLVGFGVPVPLGIFSQPRHLVESNWRTQNLYYRRLDQLSVRLAVRLEEEGERAIPTLGCLPVETHAPFSIAGYLNQIRIGEVTRIGARGRNGLLVHPRYGSRLMLGGVVTTAALPRRAEPEPVEAGCPPDCRRCVEACPIAAIRPEERSIDSPACLRYTARTPLVPRWRYLWLHLLGRHKKATRLLNVTSLDEHTFHVCSRCVSACPS